MKFKNLETGKIYPNWEYTNCPGNCEDCPLCSQNNPDQVICADYIEDHPLEAKKIGFMPVFDDENPCPEEYTEPGMSVKKVSDWITSHECPHCHAKFQNMTKYCPACGRQLIRYE